MRKELTSTKLIIIVSVFFVLFGNYTFFVNLTRVYPVNQDNALFLFSLAIVSICLLIFLFSLVCYRSTIKPILIIVLLISSLAAYFMDTYHVVIDVDMIDNVMKTDVGESSDLLSLKQLIYFFLLGILPSIFVYKTIIVRQSFKKAIISRLMLIVLSLGIMILIMFPFGSSYASFIREHKPLRFYANPTYYIYSLGKYIGQNPNQQSMELKKIALDASIENTDKQRKLVVLVVGEAARADHFSLNGYGKKTNPELEKEAIISYQNVWSCGTSTAASLPCMFSVYDRSDYSKSKANSTENVLDILQSLGINTTWFDNNSDSKNVATRISYKSYKTSETNPVCDPECRDVGMLPDLQSYIDGHQQGDIFIVLHQMGNHGPAYYKRYPEKYEKFKPVCRTNQLEECSRDEINNAYDNAILYTDYFLSETIKLLKKNNEDFETALIYASDHGESLGENGLYLHGLPYMVAPDTQKHIPLIVWFSDNFNQNRIDGDLLRKKINLKYSHDNLFHSILGLMEVKTTAYDKTLDMFSDENTE